MTAVEQVSGAIQPAPNRVGVRLFRAAMRRGSEWRPMTGKPGKTRLAGRHRAPNAFEAAQKFLADRFGTQGPGARIFTGKNLPGARCRVAQQPAGP